MSKDVTYRIIYFTEARRYIAMAWNYKIAAMVATTDHAEYSAAKLELQHMCHDRGLVMRWYDGEYECRDGETLLSIDGTTSRPL